MNRYEYRRMEEYVSVVSELPSISESVSWNASRLRLLQEKLSKYPCDYVLPDEVKSALAKRLEMINQRGIVDWTTAEVLALATLAVEGVGVRLSGSSTEFGPFEDRYVVLRDQRTGSIHVPISDLSHDQASVDVLMSDLDEFASFSLEYAYSMGFSEGLLIWEAAGDDFVSRWCDVIHQLTKRGTSEFGGNSSIVLLVPRNREGAGSGGSIPWPKQWIQMVIQDAIRVCSPATPAQYFHLLRRQGLDKPGRPLVVLLPATASDDENVSPLNDLVDGDFEPVLKDALVDPNRMRTVILCSNRVFNTVKAGRIGKTRPDFAVVGLQQMYPFTDRMISQLLKEYRNASEWIWVQEESETDGIWPYISFHLSAYLQRVGNARPDFRAISTVLSDFMTTVKAPQYGAVGIVDSIEFQADDHDAGGGSSVCLPTRERSADDETST